MSSVPDITLMLMRDKSNIDCTCTFNRPFFNHRNDSRLIQSVSKQTVDRFYWIYVEIFRGTSLIVQLFWLSYALPGLFNIHLGSDIWVAVLAISLNYGAICLKL